MTIRTILTIFLAVIVAELILLAIVISMMIAGQQDLADTENRRYQSYKIADELRQSSDDLTRMARTYVATGNPIYENYFRDILEIRNGTKPRPANYDRIYWDLVIATGAKPKYQGTKISLKDTMAGLNLSARERALLAEAQANSDSLVSLEKTAMDAVKGRFPEGPGETVVQRDPDPELARALMFGEIYHKAKASIMKPIDAFLVLLEQRMNNEVAAARATLRKNVTSAAILVAFTLLTLAALALAIGRRVLGPVGELIKQSDAIAKGNYGYQVSLRANDEIGILSRAFNRMSQAVEMDISRRTEAEAALRDSREELRQSQLLLEKIMDQMPAHIFLRDTEGRFVLVNSRYEEVYGLARKDIIGKTLDEVFDAERAEYFRSFDKQAIATGRVIEHEMSLPSQDGERTFSSLKFHIRGMGDAVKMVGGVSFETTNLRRSEQIRLRQSGKLELLGQMTGSIAHDFNNVMTVLSCNVPLLNSEKITPEKQKQLIRDCNEAVGMASNLTKRLMAIARKEPLERTFADLNDLIGNLEDFLRRSVGRDATLKFELDDEPIPVIIDAVLAEMALLNLVLNSRDAMPDGGTITIKTSRAVKEEVMAVDWGTAQIGHYAVLEVGDTGTGMSPEVKKKLFEAFFTTKEKGKGTGLGLNTVQDLAAESDGYIEIDSQPGRGTSIKVFIPLVKDDEAEYAEVPISAAQGSD
jgi:PAS domain S-box-containing protein